MFSLSACVLVLLAAPGNPATSGRLAGIVSDADSGTPLAGAKVAINLVIDKPDGSFGQEPRQTTTGRDGTFSFDPLPPGSYVVTVEKTGYARYPDFSLDGLPERMIIGNGQPASPLKISLHKAAVMTGRVIDKSGEPEAGLHVWALKPGGQAGFTDALPMGNTETNDLGEYRMGGLSAGDYLIVASPHRDDPFTAAQSPSSTTLAPTYFSGTTDRGAARVITVQAGETVPNLDFTIAAVAAFPVSGITVDDKGSPSPNVIVILLPDTTNGGLFEPIMRVSREDGTFMFADMVPGRYRISAIRGEGGGGGVGGFAMSVDESGHSSLPGTLITVSAAAIKGLKVVVDHK